MQKIIFLLLALVAVPSFAQQEVDITSGRFWHQQCNGGTVEGYRICLVYVGGTVMGAKGQAAITQTRELLCIPPKTTFGQMANVFARFLARHPEEHRNDATVLVFHALTDAFPCAIS